MWERRVQEESLGVSQRERTRGDSGHNIDA